MNVSNTLTSDQVFPGLTVMSIGTQQKLQCAIHCLY